MKVALINKDGYKIIFGDENEAYEVLKTKGGYHNITYDEFEEILYEPNTRICGIKENGSLIDYFKEVNKEYYCIWISKLNMMSLYKYSDNGDKFIKNIVLTANIKPIIIFANKHSCSI